MKTNRPFLGSKNLILVNFAFYFRSKHLTLVFFTVYFRSKNLTSVFWGVFFSKSKYRPNDSIIGLYQRALLTTQRGASRIKGDFSMINKNATTSPM